MEHNKVNLTTKKRCFYDQRFDVYENTITMGHLVKDAVNNAKLDDIV
jgi:hypothetical protein